MIIDRFVLWVLLGQWFKVTLTTGNSHTHPSLPSPTQPLDNVVVFTRFDLGKIPQISMLAS